VGDGFSPNELIQGSDGLLYGTTQGGGANSRGTIFALNLDGSSYGIIYNFQGSIYGSTPYAPVFEASDGFLYGTTRSGGTNNWTVYRVNKDGSNFQSYTPSVGPAETARIPTCLGCGRRGRVALLHDALGWERWLRHCLGDQQRWINSWRSALPGRYRR